MSVDVIARGLASQARAKAVANATGLATLAALARDVDDGSIVALGDSITGNTVMNAQVSSQSDSWYTKGILTMLVARAGGRLKATRIAGWPYVNGTVPNAVAQVLVARGGSGYTAATTLSFQTGVGGSGTTATPTVTNGVITRVTVTAPGTVYGQAPIVTVTDPGGGTGAVLTAQLVGTGEYAVGGIGTQEMEAYVPLILNNGSPVARNVLFLGGTNNFSRGISLADSKASILSICRRLVAGGVRVIAVAPLPRTSANGSQAKRQQEALRWWYVEQLATLVPGVVVVDASAVVSDSNTYGTLANVLSDGLHPSALGADAIAQAIWAQIAPLFPIGGQATLIRTFDDYDATYHPQGNMLLNALTDNTSFGAPVAPGAGEAPWTGARGNKLYLSRVSGGTGTGTIAASVDARGAPSGGYYQTLTVNVTGAAAGETYRLTWSADGSAPTLQVGGSNILQPGDTVRAEIAEVALSNVVNMRAVPKLKLIAAYYGSGQTLTPTAATVTAGIIGTAAWGDWEDASQPPFVATAPLFLRARELVIPTGTSFLTMTLEFVVNAAGAASFTARLFGASVRRL